jgi:hypothetical protein
MIIQLQILHAISGRQLSFWAIWKVNYISSYQAQINPSQNQGSPVMTQNPAMRDVQIKITRHPNQPEGYNIPALMPSSLTMHPSAKKHHLSSANFEHSTAHY